ncbi:cell division protein SepF [Gandjariella thermophila]|uniref:Cell division protein SepF n=1 Tax=Gandjariella thermophila TaxID=1931992 RepID=A0A4D4J7P1_9PSEU|nr:cell division protein SepF [Gandjariella thermophila]GDY32805.1 cell division protein SepF [Gandjariella thermophila]
MSGLQKLKAYFGMVPAEDEFDDPAYDYDGEADDYPPYGNRGGRRRVGYRADLEDVDDYDGARGRGRRGWSTENPVRGALAVDTQREPAARTRPAAEAGGYPVGRITTLHPRSFNEARTIGEHYREGTPVIINLTDMEDADARRLVDFAAGLAFALRGDIDRVTNKVFLLSPPNVDVTAEDKRRIAEGGFFARD